MTLKDLQLEYKSNTGFDVPDTLGILFDCAEGKRVLYKDMENLIRYVEWLEERNLNTNLK